MSDSLSKAEPAAAAGGLRALKKRQTRTDIATAAAELVAQHGMDATTVEMIAELAGVSARTFFNYFESKAEAVLANTADTFDALRTLLASRTADENPLVAVRETFCEFVATTRLGDGSDSRIKAILESNPQLKAELDRVFSALRNQLTSQLVARYPADPRAPVAASVAVAVAFALLWLAYFDAAASAEDRLSEARLREYFDVLRAYPLTT